MNLVGAIGMAAAWANYRSAKADYEALKEQQEGLIAAVQTYENAKYDEYTNRNSDPDNAIPSGMDTTTTLRVGNLVGSFFRYQQSVVFINSSDKTYHIKSVKVRCAVLGMDVGEEKIACNNTIAPGAVVEIISAKKVLGGTGDFMSELRNLICKAAGKKLITSCPKLSIKGAEEANIKITYTVDGENQVKEYYYNGKPGDLRYCGEAYL